MRRGLLLLCVVASLLAGCATAPQDNERQAKGDGQAFAEKSHISGPVNHLAQRVRALRRSSLEAIRRALLNEHDRWQGTPYVLGGEGLRGIDCSALVQRVYSEAFALELPRTTRGQVHEGSFVEREALEAGDLVFFRPPGVYRHVGIYIGDGYFLHASASKGVTLSRLDNVFWHRHYWQARRPLPLTEIAQRLE